MEPTSITKLEILDLKSSLPGKDSLLLSTSDEPSSDTEKQSTSRNSKSPFHAIGIQRAIVCTLSKPMSVPTFDAMGDSFTSSSLSATVMRGTRRRGRPPKNLNLSRRSPYKGYSSFKTMPSAHSRSGANADAFDAPAIRTLRTGTRGAKRRVLMERTPARASEKLGSAPASATATDVPHDAFCWTCHRDTGRLHFCAKCPRVFHARCLQSPYLETPTLWNCPECEVRQKYLQNLGFGTQIKICNDILSFSFRFQNV